MQTDALHAHVEEVVRPLREQLRLKEAEAWRYKDALYHIAYRGADPKTTALKALGDLEPQADEEMRGS